MTPEAAKAAVRRRRRAIGHQCPDCRGVWALKVVDHAAGRVVVCRFCSQVRIVLPSREDDLVGSA